MGFSEKRTMLPFETRIGECGIKRIGGGGVSYASGINKGVWDKKKKLLILQDVDSKGENKVGVGRPPSHFMFDEEDVVLLVGKYAWTEAGAGKFAVEG
jgi:hypothetical protein